MKKVLVILILCIIFAMNLNATNFGKNKIKYQDFEWSVMETTHFDIYFEKNLEFVGQTSALIIEEAYYRFQDLFEYSLPQRIPVIIYNSHNEFQQTNVIYQLIEEGTGGFTEFIKNRIVVPFDGSYKRFELTLIHELTHVFCFFALQGSSLSNFTSSIIFSMPLWLTEGFAEFCSVHGTSNYNEMFMIDLVINDAIVPLDDIGYSYYAYREGESFLLFLESKFGTKSIVEFLYNFKIYKNLEESAKKTFGVSLESLEEQWKISLKRKYSEFIVENEVPEEKFEKITHHKNGENSYNINPCFSPDGTDILFFSDKSMNMSIYKTSTMGLYEEKKLVSSGSSGKFEDFHYMKNSISLFPDGKKFAFVTKTSKGDKISICDLQNGKEVERIDLDFDAIFELDVAPKGDKIVFVGQKDAQNDLYIYNFEEKSVSRLTDDYFDDRYPKWSLDEKKICFASERFVDSLKVKNDDEQFIFANLYYNIFIYDFEKNDILAVTNEQYNHQYPIWSESGDNLVFTSYKDGLANIYAYNFSDEGMSKITNIFSGCFSPDISKMGDYLVFSAFHQRGWDLYLCTNPLDSLEYFAHSSLQKTKDFSFQQSFSISDYKQYYKKKKSNFPQQRAKYYSKFFLEKDSLEAKPDTTKNREPKIKDYHLIFTPDLLFGGLGYSTMGGLSAQLWIALSDILGNHHIQIVTDATGSVDESNIIINYYYLKNRLDFGIGFFNLVENYYYLNLWENNGELYDGLRKKRDIGVQTLVSYPIDKFNRFDFYNMLRFWNEEWFSWQNDDWHLESGYSEKSTIFSTALFFVHDTAIWGYTGPIKGSRINVGVEKSFSKKLSYLNFYSDFRKYIPLSREYQFAYQLEVNSSIGKDKQEFVLGGYYSLRGYSENEFLGNNIALSSIEFRYPFIKSFRLGFPLPIWLRNIRGAIFSDFGYVWNSYDEFKSNRMNDIKIGYGFGTRMNLGYFVLKFDWAWRADKDIYKQHPSFYFSLNAEF